MRGSRKFLFQRRTNLKKNIYIFIIFYSFLVDNWIEDPNTVINGPSSASQRNAVEMTLRCRADKGPTLNVGLVAL